MKTAIRYGKPLRSLWLLEKDMDFLNHGSFGATPKRVLAAQAGWRRRMERQPVEFLAGRLGGLLRAAAARLAAFVGARGEDLAFVENATAGVNTVLRSIPWRRGDELVLSSHAYPAVRNAARRVAASAGVVLREARVPFPPRGPGEIARAYARVLGPGTRLAIVDHVSSPTALVFPAREIAALCRKAGALALVDGAHAPGMLELDVAAIGAHWYVGNCHKWLFAPKGCAFLWASEEGKEGLHPLAVSNRYGEGFTAEFDWCGTRDPSPWLCVHAALDFFEALGGRRLMRRNRELACRMGERLCRAWGAPLPPRGLCGSMLSIRLPHPQAADQAAAERMHDRLWRRRIEAPLFCLDGRLLLRISAQAYNEESDYGALEAAVPALLSAQTER